MKASELRIGNWYQWYSEGKYFNFQVEDRDFVSKNIKNFEPIPLTEEWLLKLKFFTDGRKYYWMPCGIEVFLNDEGFVLKVLFKGYLIKNIIHIHQLQNLYFALCDEELELK